jgi:hypothetical protein
MPTIRSTQKGQILLLKGLAFVHFLSIMQDLYIVDLSTFLASKEAWQLHKKVGFYAISSFTKAPDSLSVILHNLFYALI